MCRRLFALLRHSHETSQVVWRLSVVPVALRACTKALSLPGLLPPTAKRTREKTGSQMEGQEHSGLCALLRVA